MRIYFLLIFLVVSSLVDGSDGTLKNNDMNPNEHQDVRQPSVQQPTEATLMKASSKKLKNDRKHANARQVGGESIIRLADTAECGPELHKLCSKQVSKNNFAALDCLQRDQQTAQSISSRCQHVLWQFKYNLTHDKNFDQLAEGVCASDFHNMTECGNIDAGTGQRISCMVENRAQVHDENCLHFLKRMEPIVFSDYRLVYKFAQKCRTDILASKCGRLGGVASKKGDSNEADDDDNEDDEESKVERSLPNSQGKVIECLFKKFKDQDSLSDLCQHEILRIAELQADDFHADRHLFYACREDRETICGSVVAGNGKVYKCLAASKFDKRMSKECRQQISKRQVLAQKNYKVDFDFAQSCSAEIAEHRCNDALRSDNSKSMSRLGHVLLCLENAAKNDPQSLGGRCVKAVLRLRTSFMEDYKLSPEVVLHCTNSAIKFCPKSSDGSSLVRGGATLHCLMDLRRAKPGQADKLDEPCIRALEDLVKIADPSSDIRVDPVIERACYPLITSVCSQVKPGQGALYACLLDHLGQKDMTEDCGQHLVELQYIVSREFTLSYQLFMACRSDAVKLCSAPDEWYKPVDNTPSRGPIVFNCLYQHMVRGGNSSSVALMDDNTDADESKVVMPLIPPSKKCAQEIRRTLHYRASQVDLQPRIYEPCLPDLAEFCLNRREKGMEIQCLQDNLESLKSTCKEAIEEFSREADNDVSVDRILVKSCAPMIAKFCQQEMDSNEGEAGEVMHCLIKNKLAPDMNPKCRAGIEHHQLIGLKDYHFSYRFSEACRANIKDLCPKMISKADVVSCLSEILRNDTLLESPHRLAARCSKELRFELLQRSENVRLDPKLAMACERDLAKYCANVEPGRENLFRCLSKHQRDLEDQCHRIIFKREAQLAVDVRTDERVMRLCQRMIYKHCDNLADHSNYMQCLKENMHDPKFDKKCRKVIYERLKLQSKDIRLDPRLKRSCDADITKFCEKEMSIALNSPPQGRGKFVELEGSVIRCLKVQYTKDKLSDDCTTHMRGLIIESNLNAHLDPTLRKVCQRTLIHRCSMELEGTDGEDGDGRITECIKQAFVKKQLHPKDVDCAKEVLRLVSEGRADVHVDPVLYKACASELRTMCRDVPLGGGRQMSCLLSIREDKKAIVHMSHACRRQLSDRVEMWENAAKIAPPENLNELYMQVSSSPQRNFFYLVIGGVILLIFIFGLCSGRVTKRVRVAEKNK